MERTTLKFFCVTFVFAAALVSPCQRLFAAPKIDSAQLNEIREQIKVLKKQYEERIGELERRLEEAEKRLQPRDTDNVVSLPPSHVSPSKDGGVKRTNLFNPDVSLILQGKLSSLKDIPGRNLNGFVSPANQEVIKRGFSADESELVLTANVDPYWRGKAVLSLINDSSVGVEEAVAERTGLASGLNLQLGRFRSGIGYINAQHPHAWDFVDAPLAYTALFGTRGSLTQEGVQTKWLLAPVDSVALSFGLEAGRGVSFPATERNKNDADVLSAFAKLGGDAGVEHAWQAGASYLRFNAKDRESSFTDDTDQEVIGKFNGKTGLWLADFIWKWAPNGNPSYRNLKLQGEYFWRDEVGDLGCHNLDASTTASCNGQVGAYETRQSGGYAQAVYQFMPRWRVGYRADLLNSGSLSIQTTSLPNLNANSSALRAYQPRRDSLMLDYSWSEFSRMRLQMAQDQSMQDTVDNQIYLQYIMSLGAHGAHRF